VLPRTLFQRHASDNVSQARQVLMITVKDQNGFQCVNWGLRAHHNVSEMVPLV